MIFQQWRGVTGPETASWYKKGWGPLFYHTKILKICKSGGNHGDKQEKEDEKTRSYIQHQKSLSLITYET